MSSAQTETTNIAVPVDLKALMEKAAVQAMQAEKPDNKFISFKSGVLSYNGNVAPGNKIQVIIVGNCFENQYFPGKYDPNKLASPDCYAVAHDEDELAPVPEDCTKAVSPSCTDCPLNEWESDPNGGKGKACKNTRRLGMIVASQVGDSMNAEVAYARLPVTSVANWAKYVNQIGNVVKRPPWGVITEMSVIPDMKSQFKVCFQFVGIVEDQHLEDVHRLYDATYKAILFGYPKNDEKAQEEFVTKTAAAKGKKF
jgi:hypothetical protein